MNPPSRTRNVVPVIKLDNEYSHRCPKKIDYIYMRVSAEEELEHAERGTHD